MMGSFSRLAKETKADSIQAPLEAARAAINLLFKVVQARLDRNKAGWKAQFSDFCTTGEYLDQAQLAKARVQDALDALMFGSIRNPLL